MCQIRQPPLSSSSAGGSEGLQGGAVAQRAQGELQYDAPEHEYEGAEPPPMDGFADLDVERCGAAPAPPPAPSASGLLLL